MQIELDGYRFDPGFCEISEDEAAEVYVAIFKLVSDQALPLFVRLENHHNGYYGHGFTFQGAELIEGVL